MSGNGGTAVFSFKLPVPSLRTRRCNPGMAPFTLQASAGCGVPRSPLFPAAGFRNPAPRILPQSASRCRRGCRIPGPTPRRSAHRLAFAVTLSGQLSLPSRALRVSWAARGRGRLGSEPTNFSPTPQRAGGRPGPRDHRGAGPALRDERARGAQSRDPHPRQRRSPKSRARSSSRRAGPVTARGAGAAAPRPPVYAPSLSPRFLGGGRL